MSYRDALSQHLRITILRLLAEQSDYALNESILRDLLKAFAFSPSRDELRTELAWLAEQRLLTIETVQDLQVARITKRGEDVAHARATVPGVRRPGPDD
ncbi:MAG: ArsR family transcriptional regulator [Alphaproteobacteria bacterium]